MQVACILIGSDLRIMPKVIRMRAHPRTLRSATMNPATHYAPHPHHAALPADPFSPHLWH